MHSAAPQTLQLLQAFMERPVEWRYGYELSRDTGLRHGTIYPQLIRLEASGLLEAFVDEGHHGRGKARRLYRLTERGREEADVLLARRSWLVGTPVAQS